MALWRCEFLPLFLCVVLLSLVDSRVPPKCNKILRSVGEFEATPSTLFTLRPTCSTGSVIWTTPSNKQIVTFYRLHQSFTMCVTAKAPGANVYRLKGPSRQLIASSNTASGQLGCFESHCGHVTLLFEADSAVIDPEATRLRYVYHVERDARCPLCTETCRKSCLCTGEYAFTGKLQNTVYQDGVYTHYFRVANFVKYDNVYDQRYLHVPEMQCQSKVEFEGNSTNTSELDMLQVEPNARPNLTVLPTQQVDLLAIPRDGLVKAYSKCVLKVRKTYFVSTHFHVGKKSRGKLVICCASADERFTMGHLEDLLNREQCC